MSTQQLLNEAMALPVSERITIAQTLWESLDAGLPETDSLSAVREAMRRDSEMDSGSVQGRTHVSVMETARRAIRCG